MDDSPMAEPAAEPNHSSPAAEPPTMPLPGRVVGVAHEYQDLIAMIRARIVELNISFEQADAICGLPAGYVGKLVNDQRRLGVLSLGCVLAALGLAIVIVEDAEQTVKMRPRLVLRRHPPHFKPVSSWHESPSAD
jgi:hypothetical protein